MTRWNYETSSKNYLRAKLENFGKGNDTPYFKITKWNWMEAEKVWEWAFIEWTLQHITAKETQYWIYILFDIEDADNNAIQWGMKLGQTMRNLLFKLYSPAMNDKKINNIMLKTWVFNEKKFVSILVDWEKVENPYSKWNEAFQKFDISPEITEKIRIVKDPETWEVIKKDETKLDERIIHLIIPTINSCLRKEWEAFWSAATETKVDWTPVDNTPTIEDRDLTQELKDKNATDDLDILPF
jgi:hypothetical protein